MFLLELNVILEFLDGFLKVVICDIEIILSLSFVSFVSTIPIIFFEMNAEDVYHVTLSLLVTLTIYYGSLQNRSIYTYYKKSKILEFGIMSSFFQ